MGRPDHTIGFLSAVGKRFGDFIPASCCNYQAFYLLAVHPHFCLEPRQEILVPASFHMGQHVVFHSLLLRHYLPVHTSSQDLES